MDGPDNPPLRIGEFLISEHPEGGLWIEKGGGEGMRVTGGMMKTLINLLELFFRENM